VTASEESVLITARLRERPVNFRLAQGMECAKRSVRRLVESGRKMREAGLFVMIADGF